MSSPLKAGRPSSRKSKTELLSSLADTPEMKRINFEVPAQMHKALKAYAATQGLTVKEILTKYIEETLSKASNE